LEDLVKVKGKRRGERLDRREPGGRTKKSEKKFAFWRRLRTRVWIGWNHAEMLTIATVAIRGRDDATPYHPLESERVVVMAKNTESNPKSAPAPRPSRLIITTLPGPHESALNRIDR